MIRIYFDENAANPVLDSRHPNSGVPDYFEGPGTGGEVTAVRYLYNPTNATDRYEDITLTGFQDDAVTDLQYALDDGLGNPGTWLNTITLPDGDYAVPYKVHVKVIFAPTAEPTRKTTAKHWTQAQKRFLK